MGGRKPRTLEASEDHLWARQNGILEQCRKKIPAQSSFPSALEIARMVFTDEAQVRK